MVTSTKSSNPRAWRSPRKRVQDRRRGRCGAAIGRGGCGRPRRGARWPAARSGHWSVRRTARWHRLRAGRSLESGRRRCPRLTDSVTNRHTSCWVALMNASSARAFPRAAAKASSVTASSSLDAVMANHLSFAGPLSLRPFVVDPAAGLGRPVDWPEMPASPSSGGRCGRGAHDISVGIGCSPPARARALPRHQQREHQA